jgi:hypothetical protein
MALTLFVVIGLLIVADGAAYFWYMARNPEDPSLTELIRRKLPHDALSFHLRQSNP